MVPAVNDMLFPIEPTPDTPPWVEERASVAKTFRPHDVPSPRRSVPTTGTRSCCCRHRWTSGCRRAPGPLRERVGGGGAGPERDPGRLRRRAELPALRPTADAEAADLRVLHGPAFVARPHEKRCHDDVAFRYLAAGAAPDYRSIARFRRRHLEALAGLFPQALQLSQRAGMVRLDRVVLDRTKLRANASLLLNGRVWDQMQAPWCSETPRP